MGVAGVSLAGLSRAQSAAELNQELSSLGAGDLVVEIEGVERSVAYDSFDREYDLDYMLDQGFNIGRGATFVEQLVLHERVVGHDVPRGLGASRPLGSVRRGWLRPRCDVSRSR